jgi:hypothetical protein
MKPKDDDSERRNERTNQIGLFNYAESYIVSAITLIREKPRKLLFETPIEFLLFHAIELYFKSFLRGAGLDVSILESRKFGYNLRKLVAKSCEQGLNLHSTDAARLDFIQDTESAIRSRYIETGLVRKLSLDGLVETAVNVRDAAKVTFPISRPDGSESVWIVNISNEIEAFKRSRSSAQRD